MREETFMNFGGPFKEMKFYNFVAKDQNLHLRLSPSFKVIADQ